MDKKRIVWFSDFDLKGSGYLNLSIPLIQGLANLGYEIKAAGLNYMGQEHPYNVGIIPARNYAECLGIIQNLYNVWGFDMLITALDIPLQNQTLDAINKHPFKYVGIMPVEADPLCFTWAASLSRADKLFCISKFGTNEMQQKGLDATYLPVGIDTNVWKMPTDEEKKSTRGALGFKDNTFAILTVADNQERKNIWAAMKAIAHLKELVQENKLDIEIKFVLVTRQHFAYGWNLDDMAADLGITTEYMPFERGMPFRDLWGIYSGCDAFMLLSKSEGFCTLPTSLLSTSKGFKQIKDVEKNELVVTHTGKLQKVTDILVRTYNGEMLQITPKYGYPKLNLTPEHPVLSIRRKDVLNTSDFHNFSDSEMFSWIAAKELHVGDFLYCPTQDHYEDCVTSLKFSEYVHGVNVIDDIAYSIGKNQFGAVFQHPKGHVSNTINLTDNLLSLLGFYVSEGCYTDDGIVFSFHENEKLFHSEVISNLNVVFGLTAKEISHSRHRHTIHAMGCGTKLVAKLFSSLCGKSSHEKHLPKFLWELSKRQVMVFLRSMFLGDGALTKFGQRVLSYSTVSKTLADELHLLLLKFGILSSRLVANNRTEYTVAIYRQQLDKIPFITDFNAPQLDKISKHNSSALQLSDGIAIPIVDIMSFDYVGDVYNLEVAEDNSYVLGGCSVHNCMPIFEAMAMGLPCVGTDCTGIQELLQDNRGFLVPSEYVHIDPFGNSKRYWANAEMAAQKLLDIATKEKLPDTVFAHRYAEEHKWEDAVNLLDLEIMRMFTDEAQKTSEQTIE